MRTLSHDQIKWMLRMRTALFDRQERMKRMAQKITDYPFQNVILRGERWLCPET